MPVEVQVLAKVEDQPGADQIIVWATAVIDHEEDDPACTEVCIRVVESEESENLNTTYRGQNKPTNVLSFPAQVSLPDMKVLGDVVICAPVVREEAQQQSKAVTDHYAHLVIHGMLHLYGYDHVEPLQADAMEGIEREILGTMGVNDPYEVR